MPFAKCSASRVTGGEPVNNQEAPGLRNSNDYRLKQNKQQGGKKHNCRLDRLWQHMAGLIMFQLLSFDCMLIRCHTGRCRVLQRYYYHHSFIQINNNRCVWVDFSFSFDEPLHLHSQLVHLWHAAKYCCRLWQKVATAARENSRARVDRQKNRDRRRHRLQYAVLPPDAAKSPALGPFVAAAFAAAAGITESIQPKLWRRLRSRQMFSSIMDASKATAR